MDIERFFAEHHSSPSRAFSDSTNHPHFAVPEEVRRAANLGWPIFPVSLIAKLTGNPDLLIGEATCDISRLKELTAGYEPIAWRIAIGPSGLCVLQLDGPDGRRSFASLSQDQEECLTTLQARRGDTAWAFFLRPTGLAMRTSAKHLAAGVSMLGEGDSCILPPSDGAAFTNPWADIESVPDWLRELAFETPETPAGKAATVPAFSYPPPQCRSHVRFPNQQPRKARKGHPVRGQRGWRGGFRVPSRR